MWISLLVLCAVVAMTATNPADVRHENSLIGPFKVSVPGGADMDIENWTKTHDAQIYDTFIRLTPSEPHKSGAMWNYKPVQINDFEFHVDFRIHGEGSGGNGFAIWYTKDPYVAGPVFGHTDYFNGMGVFIDTQEFHSPPHKHMHPYISAVVNNGSLAYQHGEDGTLYQLGGCHMPIRNRQIPSRIAVSYLTNVLTIYVDLAGDQAGWQVCLRSEGVYLPTGYYLGVTSTTGEHADNHDLLGISTLDLRLQGWEDKHYIIPHADFIQLLPPEHHVHEVPAHKEIEEPAHMEVEEPAHQELVAEEDSDSDDDEDEDNEVDDSHHRNDEHQQNAEEKHHQKRETHQEVKKEALSPPSSSLFRKIIYISGFTIIVLIGISLMKKYLAQRKERMHKRLY